jgi:hypothetical protein
LPRAYSCCPFRAHVEKVELEEEKATSIDKCCLFAYFKAEKRINIWQKRRKEVILQPIYE